MELHVNSFGKKESYVGIIIYGKGFETGFMCKNNRVIIAPSPFQFMDGWTVKGVIKEATKRRLAYKVTPSSYKYKKCKKIDSKSSLIKKVKELEKELSMIHIASGCGENERIPVVINCHTYEGVADLRRRYNSLHAAFSTICTTVNSLK